MSHQMWNSTSLVKYQTTVQTGEKLLHVRRNLVNQNVKHLSRFEAAKPGLEENRLEYQQFSSNQDFCL